MPPAVNMDAIREALARRAGGGAAIPAAAQISGAMGRLPTGGASTPIPQPPTAPAQPQQGAMPQQVRSGAGGGGGGNATNQALQAGQISQGPQFDDETKNLAKSLVQRLIKGI